jgi:hypothetical protein
MKMKKLQILVVVFLVLLSAWQASPVSGCEPPGTGTPGYWKNHPEAWPVEEIKINCTWYSKEAAIAIMNMPTKGDKTYTMFDALVAAKLNVMIGNPGCCISEAIHHADLWLIANPLDSHVKASSTAWQQGGECLYWKLDAYNNGELLCAPSRDTLE